MTAQAARLKNGESTRRGKNATEETSAIPAESELKHEAAKVLLREGVLGDDEHSEEFIKRLPDPILDHHKESFFSLFAFAQLNSCERPQSIK